MVERQIRILVRQRQNTKNNDGQIKEERKKMK